jgi:CRISPR-associated protein Csb2
MALVLQQSFPLGRFHATRWNQNPFEDPYGEWPPSPWRLLRALAARWFQYSRETGDSDDALRNRVLSKLAREVPHFWLPENTWRGPAIHQYHPVGLEEQYKYKKVPGSGKQALDYSFKQVGITLVQDHYRVVTRRDPIYWIWEATELESQEDRLLSQLLQRLLYFGRAESYCRFRIFTERTITPNCRLERTAGTGNPVLVAVPEDDLNLESLLAVTDSDQLKQRRIPPGTAWYYATIPAKKPVRPVPVTRRRHLPDVRVLQFAVGGRVYPPEAHWVKLTERFREAVIRQRCRQVSHARTAVYRELTDEERDTLSLIRGLDGAGNRVDGRTMAFFALIPDAEGLPTRLICWRTSPFTDDEIDAFLSATELPLAWERGSADWQVRLVALPFSVSPPADYWSGSQVWETATPFVLPAGIQRFRRGGRPRAGETPEACLRKLLVRIGLPEPLIEVGAATKWVTVHESPAERQKRSRERTTRARRGYGFRLTFPQIVPGPLAVGHSCHFGLGLFRRG